TLRNRPFHASRDFEGTTDRDIISNTLLLSHSGGKVDFSSITGFVSWKTRDVTDLDYTSRPLITRDNSEKDLQFTQEFRVSSAKPITISHNVALKLDAGLFVFSQGYDQDAVNNFAPFVLSPQLNFPVSQHSPLSALDDHGFGIYGQGTFTFAEKVDAIV